MNVRDPGQQSVSETKEADRSMVIKPAKLLGNEVSGTLSAPTYLTAFFDSLQTLWLFTKDDFDTFVLPNTIFGISAALSNLPLAQQLHVLQRIPLILFFNWSNLLIFDLANQRLPDSIKEDMINKPWRPLPTSRLSQRQTRHLILVAIPLVLLFNAVLCVWKETALLFNLTWIYNDLRGGDDNWMVRNLIIASAFFLYNLGSLKVASGASSHSEKVLGWAPYAWAAVISAVILTTMQVQDLKDQEGDRTRGRQTAPLVLGEQVARWTIALPILFWSLACALFWGVWTLPIATGLYVACRVLRERGKEEDRRSWKFWSLWTAVLYLLPLVSSISNTLSSSSLWGRYI
ncbi:MAG: hypothetical protein ALECFALPRED_008039 [Alectoria fallacina]|uniref:Uncharacterized protein n=1 Tax=Alectoria fallacina TaxID=1903189 RepID=A0A8H3J217_9LECA|nr:MAG: hypothetical protein ALECFALPRED_008039 [Alectoria fallacina]